MRSHVYLNNMVKRSKPSAADLYLHPELSVFMVFMRRGAQV